MKKKGIFSLLTMLLLVSCGGGGLSSQGGGDLSQLPVSEETSDILSEEISQTQTSEDEVSEALSEEVEQAIFPSAEIKFYLGINEDPVPYEAEDYIVQKDSQDGTPFVMVISPKGEHANCESYKAALEEAKYVVVAPEEGESVYVALSSSYTYLLGFQEMALEGQDYFVVQYMKYEPQNSGYDSEYQYSQSFPGEIIRDFLKAEVVLESYEADSYYYARTQDSQGYDCVVVYSTKSATACNAAYSETLEKAGYTVEEYEDSYGPYFDAYSYETGYEVLFYEEGTDFCLQIYFIGTGSGGEGGGDDLQSFSEFPADKISQFLGNSASVPSYESDLYYYEEMEISGYYNIVMIISAVSETACNEAYKATLEGAGYVVTFYEGTSFGDYYEAVSDKDGYDIIFYEEEGMFILEITSYEGSGDIGGGDEEEPTYEVCKEFPADKISAFLYNYAEVPAYVADTYYYEEYDLYGIIYLSMVYSEISETACNTAYYAILEAAGYEITFYPDEEYGDYYVAINATDCYQITFYEEEGVFYLEIYYYEDTSSRYDEDYISTTEFPQDLIKEYFGSTSDVVAFEAEEYFYIRSYDMYGDDIFYIYAEISETACLDYYMEAVIAAGYEVTDYDGIYGAYSSETGYEILFTEDESYGTFDIQIYYVGSGGGSQGGSGEESRYDDTFVQTDSFPQELIKEYFGSTSDVIPFEAEEYYYWRTTDSYGTDIFYIYAEISETACLDYYMPLLEAAGYDIIDYGDGLYNAYSAETGYEILFLEDPSYGTFDIQIYYVGASTGGEDVESKYDSDYVYSETFPHDVMQEFFGSSTELIMPESSAYAYARTQDRDGYDTFLIYMDMSEEACSASYMAMLEEAGYIVVDYGDFFYAYNDATGYELMFYDNDSYQTFDMQVYYYGVY